MSRINAARRAARNASRGSYSAAGDDRSAQRKAPELILPALSNRDGV